MMAMDAACWTLERLSTPLGTLLLASDAAQRLRALDWQDHEERMHRLVRRQYAGRPVQWACAEQPSRAALAMQAYFSGDIAAIDPLEVGLGGTDFQRQVWLALCAIPAGQTISYRELAQRVGRPAAVRAAGAANGANPVGIVVPCHRVVGSDQALTGYAGGLHRKQWLLDHERRHRPIAAQEPECLRPNPAPH